MGSHNSPYVLVMYVFTSPSPGVMKLLLDFFRWRFYRSTVSKLNPRNFTYGYKLLKNED